MGLTASCLGEASGDGRGSPLGESGLKARPCCAGGGAGNGALVAGEQEWSPPVAGEPGPGLAQEEELALEELTQQALPKQASLGTCSTDTQGSPSTRGATQREEASPTSTRCVDGSLSPASPSPGTLSRGTLEVLEQVRVLVDEEFLIFEAEALLAGLQENLRQLPGGEAEWEAVEALPLFERFSSNLELYIGVGEACCDQDKDWFTVYKDSTGTQTISGYFDPDSSRTFHYRVCMSIPVALPQVMLVANEVDMGQLWQPLLISPPKALGRRTACRLMVHSQMSMAGGVIKVDVMNDVRRFIHREGGFLAELLNSASQDHPCYVPPASGFRRPDTQVSNLWVSCGPKQTALIQVGRIQLPFPITRWLVNTVGTLFGKRVITELTRNALRATEPGNPWEQRFAEDALGFYCMLGQCVEAPASAARAASGDDFAQVNFEDLLRFFEARQLRRSWTHRNVVPSAK